MYTDFDKNIKEEMIVLSHIENKNKDSEDDFNFWRRMEPKDKKEIEKEMKEVEEKSKQSKEKYYKIEKQKIIELEQTFGSSKLKVHLNNPHKLGKGKMGSFSDKKFTIYETKTFNKLYEIPFENEAQIKIESVIELDNNDLVFLMLISKSKNSENNNDYFFYYNNNCDYELHIYRLKDKKYYLFQKIKEDITGYSMQNSYSGCMAYPKTFELLEIKRLSNNRILSISNYGIRMYALNLAKNNSYFLILMDIHMEGIKEIFEINDRNMIFFIKDSYGASLGGPSHDYIMIEKVELKDFTNEDIKKRLNNKRDPYDDDSYGYNSEEIISSLKIKSVCKTLLEYSTYGGSHNLSDYVVLKKRYLIIMIDYHILIFDLLTGKQMIRYTIVEDRKEDLYRYKYMQIGKWNCADDDEFYVNQRGNITLFELDDCKGINLKIIAYTYFSNEEKELNELDDNKFYIKKDNNITIY